MKRITITILIMIGFLIMDVTLVPLVFSSINILLGHMHFPVVMDTYPSILFVFIICYSIINGKYDGLWVGIVAGFLQDIYFSRGFGINSLTNMLVCITAGLIGVSIFKDKRFIPIISTFFLSLGKGIIVYIILVLVGLTFNPYNVLYTSIYNFIIAIFMYNFTYKLTQKKCMRKKWKF